MSVTARQETRESIIIENQGDKIFSVLHLPLVKTNSAVLILHGYASSKMGTNGSYLKIAKALTQQGIACLRFDFRGFGDSEGEASEMTMDAFLSDISVMTTYLEENGFSRLGFFGSSFGASLSVQAAKELGGVSSLVLWAPVASGELWLRDFFAKNPESMKKNPREVLATYRGVALNPLFQEQFSKMEAYRALEALDEVALLHFQGDADQTLSLSHQKVFKQARASARAPTSFVTYPGVDHWLGFSPVLPEVVEKMASWFKQTL